MLTFIVGGRRHWLGNSDCKLSHCTGQARFPSCELAVAEKRTLMIVAGDNGKSKTTLLGCYYFYAK